MSPERFARITDMLNKRQTDLTICLETVHKPHNLSAIVRTADAVGVHNVHAVWSTDSPRMAQGTAAGSSCWVGVKRHDNIKDAIEVMRAQGMQILATNLSPNAVDFREIDYTKPTAFLVGQERDGISDQALALADQHVVVPMLGMVQSLNVSVAGALLLYEAQRQREAAGMYDGPCTVDKTERDRLYFEGGHPIFARACLQKEMPYPQIDENGQIVADELWWQKMQMNKKAWQHLDDESDDKSDHESNH
ncbi:MAG: tRNA (guanosine-2'-O-)-methyltransferase [Phenylobacterium sp.]|jgi:tRNA (guanosine-2'-O-)-methyltransferase